MKKVIFRSCLLIVVVASYFFLNPVQQILNYEFNFIATTRFFASSLFDDTANVSATPLVVKDYMLIDERLYIFPLDDKVTLPIDVMVVGVDVGLIEVIDSDTRYTISNLTSRSKNLYQYVSSLNDLGTTADFYVVDGDNLNRISQRLLIYYERV